MSVTELEKQGTKKVEDYNDSFPLAPLFPKKYFEEIEKREQERLEGQKERSARQARLGVLNDGLRLLADGIGANKGALIEKRGSDRNVTNAYNELERYKTDHAIALRRLDADKLRTTMWEEGEKFRRSEANRQQGNFDKNFEQQKTNADRNFDLSKTNADRNWQLNQDRFDWQKQNTASPERQHQMRLEQIEKQGEETRKNLQTKNDSNATPLIFIDDNTKQSYTVTPQHINEMVASYMKPYEEAKKFNALLQPPQGMDKKAFAEEKIRAMEVIKQYEGDASFEAIKKYNLTGTADIKDKGVLTTIMKKVWNPDVYNSTNQILAGNKPGPTFVDNPQPSNANGEITRNEIDNIIEGDTSKKNDGYNDVVTRLKALPEYDKATPDQAAERIQLTFAKEQANPMAVNYDQLSDELAMYYKKMGFTNEQLTKAAADFYEGENLTWYQKEKIVKNYLMELSKLAVSNPDVLQSIM